MTQKQIMFQICGIFFGLIILCIIQAAVFAQDIPLISQQTFKIPDISDVQGDTNVFSLPSPDHSKSATLDEVLQNRRSVREYQNISISAQELSNLLWAAQGNTDGNSGKRTAPSGQQIYPITLHVVVNRGDDVPTGVYTYHVSGHQLIRELDKTGEQNLIEALGQKSVTSSAACIIMSGNYSPYQKFDTDMANQSMYLEAGHIAQNILLELTSLDLSGVPLAGFNYENVGNVLGLDSDHPVLYGIAFGK